MVRRLDAIDATTDQVHQAARAVECSTPLSQAAGVPTHVLPRAVASRWIAERTTIDQPRFVKCVARDKPRNPLPPAMTTRPRPVFSGIVIPSKYPKRRTALITARRPSDLNKKLTSTPTIPGSLSGCARCATPPTNTASTGLGRYWRVNVPEVEPGAAAPGRVAFKMR